LSISDIMIFLIKYYGSPMIANAMPVLLKNGTPIDRGRVFIDGKRILGDGKTWEGLILGIIGGFNSSLAITLYFHIEHLFILFFLASVTGLFGDIVGSFIKRRLGIQRGEPLPILDQLDFAIGSTIAYMFLGLLSIEKVVLITYSFIIILVLHLTTNMLAYKVGLKDKPW